jgi:hypothetical protein
MTQPVVVCDVGGYTFAWTDEQIKISTTGVRNHSSDGRVTGVLKIETTAPGYKPLLHSPAQFNFMATRSRDELAKRLTTRFKEIDWYARLEQVCNEVITRAQLGEAMVEIDTCEDMEPPKWLLEPILLEGLPTVVFGDRGSAKSTLCLAWAQILKLPWDDNPLDIVAPERTYHSLYLDWEVSEKALRWQCKKLQNGMSSGPFFQFYRRMTRPLASDIEAVQRLVTQSESEVIFIDSLGPASGGDLNSTEPALAFFEALGSLRTSKGGPVTPCILAHTAKNQTGKRSVYGNGFFENEARNIWEIRALQEPGDETLEVGLFHTKSSPFHGRLRPFGYKLSYTDTSTRIAPQNPEDTRGFEENLGLRRRIILHVTDNGPKSAKDIASEINVTLKAVQNATAFLKKKNELRVFNDGGFWKWALPLPIKD